MALQDLTPQLRTRLGRVERLVGLFLIVTVVLMLGGIVYFARHTAKEKGWFLEKYPYYSYVADATGIRVGTPITMMGFTVGEVTLVDQMSVEDFYRTNEYNVFVGFKIREPHDGYIWTDSRFKVGAGDFLGGRSLEITRGNSGQVTVLHLTNAPPLIHSDAYLYDPSWTNETYVRMEKQPKGYWLKVEESQPLQQELTDIATTVKQSLPSVLALTNLLTSAMQNLTNITGQFAGTIPKIDGAIEDVRKLVGDFRPALQKPGGLGDLILPTNLNTQLTLTLSNFNPGTGPLALTLSNLNSRLTDIGLTLTNVNAQLGQNTNLVADANKLVRDVGSLSTSIETLLKRHWLLRSAFKTNEAKRKK
jgi:ABC-type transporter Mla subunit MlaD